MGMAQAHAAEADRRDAERAYLALTVTQWFLCPRHPRTRTPAPRTPETAAPPHRRTAEPLIVLVQALLQPIQCPVGRQHLGDAGVGLAALANGRDELAVLQLDAVHRDVDRGHVDRLVLAVDQVVVPGRCRCRCRRCSGRTCRAARRC